MSRTHETGLNCTQRYAESALLFAFRERVTTRKPETSLVGAAGEITQLIKVR